MVKVFKLGELKALVYVGHYDHDLQKGNPRVGWSYILTINDLNYFKSRFGKSVFGTSVQITNTELKNAETNISVGALHLNEMIVDNNFDVVKDIHKIFFSYNRGKNRLDNDGTKSLNIDQLIEHYQGTKHQVGAEYVIRALGPHGAADILVNDLGITA